MATVEVVAADYVGRDLEEVTAELDQERAQRLRLDSQLGALVERIAALEPPRLVWGKSLKKDPPAATPKKPEGKDVATPTPKKEEDTDEGKKRDAETPDPNPQDTKHPKTESGGGQPIHRSGLALYT